MVRAASGFLDAGGSKVFYEAAGTGPTLVLVHDGLMHSDSWNAQWQFFSKRHRVIRCDRLVSMLLTSGRQHSLKGTSGYT